MDSHKRSQKGIPRELAGVYFILAWCEGFALFIMAVAVWILWHFGLSLAEVRVQNGPVVGHIPWAFFAALVFAVAYAIRRITRWYRTKLYQGAQSPNA